MSYTTLLTPDEEATLLLAWNTRLKELNHDPETATTGP